ncbi:MAG: FAD-dependent oxidoreductase [Planctomycetaceae bacterium]|nr:FAD-dependent oxidoreductase [Planctomycetaceae bacterium]
MDGDRGTGAVLVLGAGIHGMAIARELVLNGVNVVLVDREDLASGATSKSSRLIHGGLRYLEYGDVGLVRESLAERRINLDLAPNFVQPLRLFIPLSEAWTGLLPSAVGFFGLQRTKLGKWLAPSPKSRGYWPVRLGLSLYDWLARDDALPPSAGVALHDPAAPRVDAVRYRSMIAYSDAQMRYPERVVLALLADAEQIARESQASLKVATYAQYRREGADWYVESPRWDAPLRFLPALIVNASGANGDVALQSIGATSPPLFGGTKGSHILTWHPQLIQALNGRAVYAEAADGRPVFTLPFGDGVLIGTTDEAYSGRPEEAVATEVEIEYLLGMVRCVFGIIVRREDVAAHYSGVRPLPRSATASNAAISRDHSLQWSHAHGVPILTLVGGKLTTWRAFAEEAVHHVLGKLGRPRLQDTRRRKVPGNDPLPSGFDLDRMFHVWAQEGETTAEEVAALLPLLGTRVAEVLGAVRFEPRQAIADTPISTRVVRWMIRNEHVVGLDDLVERRLLTVFQKSLSIQQLHDLAQCLVETGWLAGTQTADVVVTSAARLRRYYGRRLA